MTTQARKRTLSVGKVLAPLVLERGKARLCDREVGEGRRLDPPFGLHGVQGSVNVVCGISLLMHLYLHSEKGEGPPGADMVLGNGLQDRALKRGVWGWWCHGCSPL